MANTPQQLLLMSTSLFSSRNILQDVRKVIQNSGTPSKCEMLQRRRIDTVMKLILSDYAKDDVCNSCHLQIWISCCLNVK